MKWLISARYWLPPGVEWHHVHNRTDPAGGIYPNSSHLPNLLIAGFALIIYRFIFDKFIDSVHVGTRDVILQKRLARMSECGARCLYYTLSFFIGFYMVSKEPQFKDITNCWRDWPFHPIPLNIAWYYWIQGGFYISLIFGILFLDTKRSDHYQMMLHHLITLSLIIVSWMVNMVRVGTLILVSHDAVDILIDLAKVFRYNGKEMALNVTFVGVVVVWVATRLIYYPFWILRSAIFDGPELILESFQWLDFYQQPFSPRIIMALLTALLILHIFWAQILFKILYDSIREGHVQDCRENRLQTKEE